MSLRTLRRYTDPVASAPFGLPRWKVIPSIDQDSRPTPPFLEPEVSLASCFRTQFAVDPGVSAKVEQYPGRLG